MLEQKTQFIQNEVLGLVIRGAFPPYTKIYAKIATEKNRARMRHIIREKIVEMAELYRQKHVSPEAHVDNIETLQKYINTQCCNFLTKEISFGIAQKLLNLYLKYEWCLNRFNHDVHPPHCPVDSIVIKQANKEGAKIPPKPPWSQMAANDYLYAIEEIGRVASKCQKNMPAWELDIFNANNPAYGFDVSVDKSVGFLSDGN